MGGRSFDAVTVARDFDDPQPTAGDGLWMMPLRTPLAATGFTQHSLGLLRERLRSSGMVPMIGGGVTGKVAEHEKNVAIEPGAALTVALVTGDFDVSGIGTVTHVEGKRVYGWGHPFFGVGACDFPLMTGYVHAIYPRQSISFKMGSPLRTVGVINADVSTCIAGWLDREPDMLPVRMTVSRDPGRQVKDLPCQDGPPAGHAEQPRVHRADQLGGHGRRAAGRADGPDEGHDRRRGPAAAGHRGHLFRFQLSPAAALRRRCSARSPD